jgi:hypothetical protein
MPGWMTYNSPTFRGDEKTCDAGKLFSDFLRNDRSEVFVF